MAEHPVFEEIRAKFFPDPTDPGDTSLADATSLLLRATADPSLTEGVEGPLNEVAAAVAKDYQKARRFGRLSVAQLHPADNGAAFLANVASTLHNNNTIVGEVSPVETGYEYTGIRWLLKHIAAYDPEKSSGSFVTGGTSANLTALLVARRKLEAEGWRGVAPVTIFATGKAHYSIEKAAGILGPRGLIEVAEVPFTPGSYTMAPAELDKMLRKRDPSRVMGVVAVAGETDTGLVDDLAAIAEITQRHGVRLHVDGAYGAPFVLSRAGHLFDGMSASDSLTVDPHKYLYTPYPGGAILFADAADHALVEGLNSHGEDYMFKTDEGKARARQDFIYNTTYLGRRRIEGSMGGQAAASLYATIRHIGRDGIAALLDHNLEMAGEFAREVASSDLALSFEPQLNTVCVEPRPELLAAYGDMDSLVEEVSATLDRDLGIYLSTTSLPDPNAPGGKRKVFRFVSTHPRTGSSEVKYIASELNRVWEEKRNA